MKSKLTYTFPVKSPSIVTKHVIISALLIAISCLTFLMTGLIAQNYNSIYWQLLDSIASNAILSLRQPFMTELMVNVSLIATMAIIGGWILILAFLIYKKRFGLLCISATIAVIGLLSGLGLKSFIHRQRPIESPLIVESNFSFPSMHSLNTTVFAFTLVFVLFVVTRSYISAMAVEMGAFVSILMVSFSRIYLGVHYLSDVFAGYLIGIGVVSLILGIAKITWLLMYRHKITAV